MIADHQFLNCANIGRFRQCHKRYDKTQVNGAEADKKRLGLGLFPRLRVKEEAPCLPITQ